MELRCKVTEMTSVTRMMRTNRCDRVTFLPRSQLKRGHQFFPADVLNGLSEAMIFLVKGLVGILGITQG